MGAACLLPDCSAVVTQSFATAELPKFCSAAHRARFHRRRESLLSAAQGLQLELDRTPRMPQRRRLERELSFVVWLLDAQYGGATDAPSPSRPRPSAWPGSLEDPGPEGRVQKVVRHLTDNGTTPSCPA